MDNGSTKLASSSETMTREEIDAWVKARVRRANWWLSSGILILTVSLLFVLFAPESTPDWVWIFVTAMVLPGMILTYCGIFYPHNVVDIVKGKMLRELESAEEAALDHTLVGTKLETCKRELDGMPELERNAVIKYLRTHYHQ